MQVRSLVCFRQGEGFRFNCDLPHTGYYVPEDKRATVTEDLVKLTKGRSLDDDMLAGPMDGI